MQFRLDSLPLKPGAMSWGFNVYGSKLPQSETSYLSILGTRSQTQFFFIFSALKKKKKEEEIIKNPGKGPLHAS